jgi:hypothetical protein
MAGMNPRAIQFPKNFNSESAIQEVRKRKRFLTGLNFEENVVIPTKVIKCDIKS